MTDCSPVQKARGDNPRYSVTVALRSFKISHPPARGPERRDTATLIVALHDDPTAFRVRLKHRQRDIARERLVFVGAT